MWWPQTLMWFTCKYCGKLQDAISLQIPSLHLQFYACFWHNSPQWARASSLMRFLDHTRQHTTVSRTPLDEWSPRRRDFYLTTHNTHNRHTSMTLVGFEPTISAGEQLQTYAWKRAANGISIYNFMCNVLFLDFTVSPSVC